MWQILLGMTKAENRAAAKAWHAEREAQRRAAAEAVAINADLAELGRFRRYLILHMKSKADGRPLIDAIDDLAEKMTGDRSALHGHNHPIGWCRLHTRKPCARGSFNRMMNPLAARAYSVEGNVLVMVGHSNGSRS